MARFSTQILYFLHMSDFSHKIVNTETIYFMIYMVIFTYASIITKLLKYTLTGKIKNRKDRMLYTGFGLNSGV